MGNYIPHQKRKRRRIVLRPGTPTAQDVLTVPAAKLEPAKPRTARVNFYASYVHFVLPFQNMEAAARLSALINSNPIKSQFAKYGIFGSISEHARGRRGEYIGTLCYLVAHSFGNSEEASRLTAQIETVVKQTFDVATQSTTWGPRNFDFETTEKPKEILSFSLKFTM